MLSHDGYLFKEFTITHMLAPQIKLMASGVVLYVIEWLLCRHHNSFFGKISPIAHTINEGCEYV